MRGYYGGFVPKENGRAPFARRGTPGGRERDEHGQSRWVGQGGARGQQNRSMSHCVGCVVATLGACRVSIRRVGTAPKTRAGKRRVLELKWGEGRGTTSRTPLQSHVPAGSAAAWQGGAVMLAVAPWLDVVTEIIDSHWLVAPGSGSSSMHGLFSREFNVPGYPYRL